MGGLCVRSQVHAPGMGPLGSSVSPLLFHRELYSQFLREMIIQPGIAKANMGVSREDVTFEDHVSKDDSRDQGYRVGRDAGFGAGKFPSPGGQEEPIWVPSWPTRYLLSAWGPLAHESCCLLFLLPGLWTQ